MTKLRTIALVLTLGMGTILAGCGDGCEHGSVSLDNGYYESWKICTDENGNQTIEST